MSHAPPDPVASPYTFDVQAEAAPVRLAFLAALHGVAAPRTQFRCLEMGCGQGLSLLLQAAMHPDSAFVGLDLLPQHIAHAQGVAAAAGLNNTVWVQADVQVLADGPAPDWVGPGFDFVICHGLTTWVTPAVRAAVFALAGGWLKPGGLFYNAYNCWPGWLSGVPVQQLVARLAPQQGLPGALAEAQRTLLALQGAGALVFEQLPGLWDRTHHLSQLDPAYLGHEYLAQDWRPVCVGDCWDEVARHGLSFLSTATLGELFDGWLPPAVQAVLAAQAPGVLRETVRDLALNQGFRRDVFVRGPVKAPSLQPASLGGWRFVLAGTRPLPDPGEPFVVQGGAVQVMGHPDTALALLAWYGRPGGATLAEVQQALGGEALGDVVQATVLLWQGGWVLPLALDRPPVAAARLNRVLGRAVAQGAPYRHLALAGTGTPLRVERDDLALVGLALEGVPQTHWDAALGALPGAQARRPDFIGGRAAAWQALGAGPLMEALASAQAIA